MEYQKINPELNEILRQNPNIPNNPNPNVYNLIPSNQYNNEFI